jgi:hypothetical protein
LGLVYGSQGDALAGLNSVEFRSGDRFLSQQGREPQQVGVGLFLQGQRLVQPRLNLRGVQLRQEIARLDPLARNHRHRLNPAAHFGLDHSPQLGADGTHGFLEGRMHFLAHRLHPDARGGKVSLDRARSGGLRAGDKTKGNDDRAQPRSEVKAFAFHSR